MSSCVYEVIEHDMGLSAKVIITSIGHSYYHWHYDYELIVVLKGSISLKILPDIYHLKAGDIVLVNSKEVHGLKRTSEENICLIIQLRQGLLKNLEDDHQCFRFYLISIRDEVRPKIPYSEFVRAAVLMGLASYEDSLASIYRMKSLLYGLVADIFEYTHYDIRQYHPECHGNEEECDTLLRIIQFVDEHYDSDNLSDELCKYIGMSEKTLYRFLKRHTDLTLKDLVTTTRLEKAQFLLTETENDICFIALECGFGNENTFYRLFKKSFGVTPTEYRQYGTVIEMNKEVKGYLEYNKSEAKSYLLSYL